MIRAVLLDIDDTLLSFEAAVRQAMREGFPRFGLGEYREEMLPVYNRVSGDLWRQIERGELTHEGLMRVRWNRVFRALGLEGDGPAFEDYFREVLFWSAVEVPGACELLAWLAPRYVVCAASNGPYGQQVNRLRVAGMLGSFDHVFISEKVGAQKPSREFYDVCMGKLRAAECPGLAPAEVMVVGDSLTSDMAGGAAYGMRTCWYHPGWTGDEEPPAGVDHVVGRLAAVPAVIGAVTGV